MNRYPVNALAQYFAQQMPANQLMYAAADDGFDPNGPIAKMLRAQRAAEAAAQAAKAQAQQPQYPQPMQGESASETLRRRMREAGLE